MKSLFNSILILFKYAKIPTFLTCIGLIFSALSAPLSLYAIKNLLDSIILFFSDGSSISPVIFWACLTALAFFIQAIMMYIKRYHTQAIRKKLYENFSDDILNHFNYIDFSCFEHSKNQDTVKNMGDEPQEKILEQFLNFVSVVEKFISILGFAILFLQISIMFSLLAIIIVIITIILHTKALNMMESLYIEQTKEDRLLLYYDQILSDKKTLLELRINNSIKNILNRQNTLAIKILDERLKKTIHSQLIIGASSFTIIFWLALIIFGLSYSLINNEISIGLFISLLGTTDTIMNSCTDLSDSLAKFLRTSLRLKYLENFMNLPTSESQTSSNTNFDKITDIRFENVSFSYPGAKEEILHNISFNISGSSCTALVGVNGAGKSTIIKLICRLYKPTKGHIYLNGIDINQISKKKYYSLFGFMFQNYGKYFFTIRENVAFGDLVHLNDDSKIINLLEIVKLGQLKNNIDKSFGNINENGIDISGGQWQKIAMARSMIGENRMLILDEPTASLDPRAENEFYSIVSKLMFQNGCLLISHRLAAAKLSDKIIVLDNGFVIEEGTHNELLDKKGLYYKMFYEQSKWYNNEVKK